MLEFASLSSFEILFKVHYTQKSIQLGMGRKQGKAAGPAISRVFLALLGATSVVATSSPEPAPQYGAGSSQKILRPADESKKLHGRFLHISGKLTKFFVEMILTFPDLHPDRFYKPGTSPDYRCHVPKSSKTRFEVDEIPGSDVVGKYGAPRTDCDSPIALTNATFQWIQDTLKDGIDFVIWTGDSARHDNDIHRPRDNKEVWGLNELMAEKMIEVFGDPDHLHDDDPDNDTIIPMLVRSVKNLITVLMELVSLPWETMIYCPTISCCPAPLIPSAITSGPGRASSLRPSTMSLPVVVTTGIRSFPGLHHTAGSLATVALPSSRSIPCTFLHPTPLSMAAMPKENRAHLR